jgi:glucose/arabinose dehydrogenase
MNQDDEIYAPEKTESSPNQEMYIRYLNPSDILVPEGFRVEVFVYGLDTPISMVFTEEGDMLIGDAGVITGNPKVIRLGKNGYEVIAEGFNPPLTGINYLDGNIYVSHRGKITLIKQDGTKVDVLSGLPSFGDHHNNQVIFGPDGKMYYGQGTATNSAVAGPDNSWIKEYSFFHDIPGRDIVLIGYNFVSENLLSEAGELTYTGAYSPYSEPNSNRFETVHGMLKASGSIMRANKDGSELELLAWGLRNPFRMKFDSFNRLFSTNHGADERGSRPIANCPDEFWMIVPGTWYGWPDYSGGEPITLPQFKPENGPQPQFVIASHPSVPPKPFAIFEPHAAIMGFDFNPNPEFGTIGDVFIAEFGSEAPETTGGKPLPGVGHRISRIDMTTGNVSDFAKNKSGVAASEDGGGGFERPIDVVFGPDGAMYVLDFAVNTPGEPDEFHPNSGVIWRISGIV